jgi:hypothetical protein
LTTALRFLVAVVEVDIADVFHARMSYYGAGVLAVAMVNAMHNMAAVMVTSARTPGGHFRIRSADADAAFCKT